MRCFYVFVHGRLRWLGETDLVELELDEFRPAGFYCHRYVLAGEEPEAITSAFRRVRENLDKQTGWIGRGMATLDLEVDEIAQAPMRKAIMPDNKGHTFYGEE